MNPDASLDPAELRAMIRAARQVNRARAAMIRRQLATLRAELAAIRADDERLAIAALMQRLCIDPTNPYRAAQIAADVADLLPPHPSIDAALADRAAEAAERAAAGVLTFAPRPGPVSTKCQT